MTKERLSSIGELYDKSQWLYSWLYYDSHSLGIHYGFWDDGVTSKPEALTKPYKEVLEILNPGESQTILDAGCGVGGACFWLANHSPANFIGITISDKQLALAKKGAVARGLQNRVSFSKQNYFKTEFPDNTFDGVFGIESLCYGYGNLESLFREMHRILKPGGTLVMLDGILLRKPSDKQETNLLENFCAGWKLLEMCNPKEILSNLESSGFEKIEFFDKTSCVEKSIQDIHKITEVFGPLVRALHFLKLITNTAANNLLSTQRQKAMYDAGLVGYGKFIAKRA